MHAAVGIPVHAPIGILVQNDGYFLSMGGLGYESDFSEGFSRR